MFIFWEAVILGEKKKKRNEKGEKEKKMRYVENEAKIF